MKLNNDSNEKDLCTNNELIETEIKYNEIKQYINTRYVCPRSNASFIRISHV